MNVEVNDIALPVNTMLKQRYRIQEVYYLGHIGIVYFGYDTFQNKEIVIKEFMPYWIANRDMDGRTVVCRSRGCMNQYQKAQATFLRECEYVGRLKKIRKPYAGCVLQMLDCFAENQTRYMITARIRGRSLQDYIENGEDFSVRDTMQMLVAIVRQVHKKGIIHCDIKPSNIILREDKKIVLIDFGSACRRGKQENMMILVSRGYSAPELYHNEPVDCRTDIYSIGAVLYYLLTDYQLPEPDDYDAQEAIPGISDFITIPKRLEDILLRTVDRDKKKRPKSLFLLQNILNK